jgi:hypothetical protein
MDAEQPLDEECLGPELELALFEHPHSFEPRDCCPRGLHRLEAERRRATYNVVWSTATSRSTIISELTVADGVFAVPAHALEDGEGMEARLT